MVARYALISTFLFGGAMAHAQNYCTPLFNNGCFNWRSMNISLASTDWTPTGDCTEYDHTAMVMTITAGVATPMLVENGVWCGVSVYADLNSDYAFGPEELLFNEYNGNQPSRVHEFSITVPQSTPSGLYRLRVLSHWGSDGINSQNGSGPCGPYEYGNYDEFALQVVGATGIATTSTAAFSLGPNPTTGLVNLLAPAPLDRVTVTGLDGRVVLDQGPAASAERIVLDLSAQAAGIYQVRCEGTLGIQVLRVLKE